MPTSEDTRKVWRTDDGVEITPNLRVFGYDWQFGNVDPAQFEPGHNLPARVDGEWFDGWFDVILDSGRRALYNGERMTTRPPAGKVDPTPDKRI